MVHNLTGLLSPALESVRCVELMVLGDDFEVGLEKTSFRLAEKFAVCHVEAFFGRNAEGVSIFDGGRKEICFVSRYCYRTPILD